jgi:hypothetical protein
MLLDRSVLGEEPLVVLTNFQRRNFWSRNRELKPVYFPVSLCFLPGICSPAMRGIFGRLSRFLPGFSSLSRFLPVLKRGLRSRFRLVLCTSSVTKGKNINVENASTLNGFLMDKVV